MGGRRVTWRLAVVHRSGYRYHGEVVSSYNEARITPLTTAYQMVLDASIEVTPAIRPQRYRDYWGTIVHSFDLHVPHDQLVVTGRSLVETRPAPVTLPVVSWDELRSAEVRDRFAEYLEPTAFAPIDGRIEAVAAELLHWNLPSEAVIAGVEWVRASLRYETGSTDVHTSALGALDGGAGVCQDFAHLTLAVLRAAGIPARYASGYLHPNADAEIGDTVSGESHAWVEAWTGGWWGIDPTNGVTVGERHVLVARGRDYADVAPLKGIYRGPTSELLAVTVELTRTA